MERNYERTLVISATIDDVFAFVDDHSKLSSHMGQSSWMMGGGRMSTEVDAGEGRAVGSHIRLAGRVFGLRVFLDEVVVKRDPPKQKVWQTVGAPRLLVMGAYRMGFEIQPVRDGCELRVFLHYDLPTGVLTRWLGRMFGDWYARWCVQQMLNGARKEFNIRAVRVIQPSVD
jgi:hypothetical protein